MPANTPTAFPAVAVDPAGSLHVDCYVRSTVPGPIGETIDAVVDRLQWLRDNEYITEYEVTLWPPAQKAIAEAVDARERTRDQLLATFERWADRHGYSLAPAFRREEIPSSPFGLGTNEPRERVRFPLVALAIHEVDETESDTDTQDEPKHDTETLCGVVPCTEPQQNGHTYTVDEWLSTIERKQDAYSRTSQYHGATAIEGQR